MTDLAQRLVTAIETRTALDPGATGLTPAEAYDVQDRCIELQGGVVTAAKLGLTSRAKQSQMNVDEPLYGWLVEGTEIGHGEALRVDELIQPRVEPEVAFVMGRSMAGAHASTNEVLRSIESVMPAIDVLDSRYSGYQFTLPDVIADNASAARYALGDPVPLADIDLRLVGCVFSKNGRIVSTAAGAAILEHPAAAVAWFVRKLAERGRELPAGTVVLAGSLTAAIPVTAGDSVTVEVDRIGSLDLIVR